MLVTETVHSFWWQRWDRNLFREGKTRTCHLCNNCDLVVRTLRQYKIVIMNGSDDGSHPEVAQDVETPQVQGEKRNTAKVAGVAARDEHPIRDEEEDEVFEDASEDGEVFFRHNVRPRAPPPMWDQPPRPAPPMVSTPPHFKPEDYDGTSDWSEYEIYFEQMAELYNWDEERKAMVLGVCLKGEARVVLASLNPAQRRSYRALTTALAQSFSPQELVHLYQAELKARKRKPDESMANLGRDVAKLVRLAYPTADPATREVIGINAFLEALPGPASEMKLHVIKGRPRSLQEAVAHATEVDAVVEAENRRNPRRRGDVRMVGSSEEDLAGQVEKLKIQLAEAKAKSGSKSDAHPQAQGRKQGQMKGRAPGKRSPKEVVCYECGGRGHFRRECPSRKKEGQGNEPRRLEKQ